MPHPASTTTTALAAALATLLAFSAPGTAQTTPEVGEAGAVAVPNAIPRESPDPRSDQPGHSQMLSPEEEQQIGRILATSGAPIDRAGIGDIRPGAVIPRTTVMKPIPPEVAEIAPGYAGYEFVALGGQICVVDPQTLVIIAVFPAA